MWVALMVRRLQVTFECSSLGKWIDVGTRSRQGQKSRQVLSRWARTRLGFGPAGSGSGGQALRAGKGGVPQPEPGRRPPRVPQSRHLCASPGTRPDRRSCCGGSGGRARTRAGSEADLEPVLTASASQGRGGTFYTFTHRVCLAGPEQR